MWTHDTRDTKFILVVDNFGIKYKSTGNIKHLLDALKDLYKITIDWMGTHFIGIDLEWDYNKRICDILMMDYVVNALTQFKSHQNKTLHAPSLHIVRFG